ncbi:MAG: hypothetical protein MRY83_03140, partial [Flavobacteriales bacterium]|nr:hypothetical protein [Flavobacteriales bacterium]
MRYLLFFTALFIMGCSTLQNTSINQKPYNPQAKFFPVEVQKIEFYMGMSKDSIPLKYLNRLQDNEGDYRERYIIPNFSQRIDTLVYYLDIDDDKPLYEILLKINKN